MFVTLSYSFFQSTGKRAYRWQGQFLLWKGVGLLPPLSGRVCVVCTHTQNRRSGKVECPKYRRVNTRMHCGGSVSWCGRCGKERGVSPKREAQGDLTSHPSHCWAPAEECRQGLEGTLYAHVPSGPFKTATMWQQTGGPWTGT